MLKRLTNNWTLKITSMVLAIALWSHVRGEVNPWETATFRVPLRATPPRNIVLSPDSKLPAMIRVTLRGPRSSLRQLKGSTPANPLAPDDEVPFVGGDQVRARLDFSTARKGRQKIPVVAETEIEDVEVVGTRPAAIEVTLDRAESDDFTVRPQFAPAAVSGLRLVDTTVAPERAVVYGPSSLLSRVVSVRALADDRTVSPGALSLTKIPLVALDENGRAVANVQVEPQFVQIKSTVREEQGTRQLRVDVRLAGEPSTGYLVSSTTTSPARLTVRGPVRTLRKLNSLRVTLDVSRATDDVERRVEVPLPKGVTAAGPARVLAAAEIARSESADETPATDTSSDQGSPESDSTVDGTRRPSAAPTASRASRATTSLSGSSRPRNTRSSNAPTGDGAPSRAHVDGNPALPPPAPHP